MLNLQAVYELVDRSRPVPFWARGEAVFFGGLLVLLGVLALMGRVLPVPDRIADGIPWLFLAGVFLFSWRTARRQRSQQRILTEVMEAVQQEDAVGAEGLLTKLLARPLRDAIGRTQALLSLASIAELQKQFEAAQFVYESILSEDTPVPILTPTAELGLAASQLRTEQLSDAVDRIDKLQRADLPDSMRADVELLALFREVLMGRPAAAVEQIGPRRELFRKYLSTRAAYGYALTAAALDATGRHEEASRFWQDATLLVGPQKLIDRIEILAPLSDRYPAAVSPW